MLLAATTVKDSLDNVRFFVDANLASGLDHLVVFLDAPGESDQREVAEHLDGHPHVTCVRTGRDWWAGDRPASLNVRQRINANWTRALLEPFDWAEWVFHIDGDEVARLDRDALAEVPADADAVRLPPLEAVSEWSPDGRPTLFKRLLEDDELNLLRVLGVLDEATNQAYFHGHVMGKSGVRPSSGLGLTLHEAVAPDGQRRRPHQDDRLGVLHYDAVSGEEFVRKWSALAAAGPARYRASRQPMARALKSLISRDLPEEVRATYLRRVYERTTADDVQVLDDLGLLERVDPLRGGLRPRPLPTGADEALGARVDELRAAPKRPFFVADAARDRASAPGERGSARGRLKRIVQRG
jgi:hypothetical protein